MRALNFVQMLINRQCSNVIVWSERPSLYQMKGVAHNETGKEYYVLVFVYTVPLRTNVLSECPFIKQ